jgi:hypothetical protein
MYPATGAESVVQQMRGMGDRAAGADGCGDHGGLGQLRIVGTGIVRGLGVDLDASRLRFFMSYMRIPCRSGDEGLGGNGPACRQCERPTHAVRRGMATGYIVTADRPGLFKPRRAAPGGAPSAYPPSCVW